MSSERQQRIFCLTRNCLARLFIMRVSSILRRYDGDAAIAMTAFGQGKNLQVSPILYGNADFLDRK